jgi:hypothetical protein
MAPPCFDFSSPRPNKRREKGEMEQWEKGEKERECVLRAGEVFDIAKCPAKQRARADHCIPLGYKRALNVEGQRGQRRLVRSVCSLSSYSTLSHSSHSEAIRGQWYPLISHPWPSAISNTAILSTCRLLRPTYLLWLKLVHPTGIYHQSLHILLSEQLMLHQSLNHCPITPKSSRDQLKSHLHLMHLSPISI